MKKLLQRIGLVVVTAVLMPQCLCAQGRAALPFTEEHPLVYEDAWDLQPYSFLDKNNKPTGYNVELIRMLMEELDIPYVIKLKERREVLNDMKTDHAHLTMGMDALFHDEYGYYGKKVIQLFTHSVLTPSSHPVQVHTEADLGRQKVMVHKNSYSHHLMMEKGWGDNAIPLGDMKNAVFQLSEKENGQIVWNTASLRWLVYEQGIDNLRLTAIDMPHGEYKFIARDSTLLCLLDSTFAELNTAEMLDDMQARWFHPERTETGIPGWVWYLTVLMAIVAIVLIFYNVSYRLGERRLASQAEQRHARLSLILQASHVRIWTYDVASQLFTFMDRNGQPQRQYSGIEFARRYRPEDFRRIGEGIRRLIAGTDEHVRLELKARDDEFDGEDEREFVMQLSVLRRENGRPTVIIGTKSDVTEEHARQRKTKERMQRYQAVFESAMVDMVYYDEHGMVSQMNERARRTFGMGVEEIRDRNISIERSINEENFRFADFDYFYATCFLDIGKGYESHEKVHQESNTMYYEMQMVPVRTSDQKMLGAYGTGRDVTEVALTYRKLLGGISRLQSANKEVTDYVQNINYVLGVGGMRMVNYSPDTHTLTVFKSLDVVQIALTQSRCMTIIDEQSKRAAMRALNNMDNRSTAVVDMNIKTTLRRGGIPLHLYVRLIPLTADNGRVKEYFGLCRDISEQANTELLLERETLRAQEVENLKNSFLRNMSYEIRTPLNSVVGFAELFEQEHQPEDEEVFIREIKSSSSHLLHLINDILFLSRLDAQMIEINKQPIDFAQTFEGHCQIGWTNDMKDGVNYIVENPYERLVVDIDDANMGRIIEQLAANAAQHTESGTVRARYDYIGGKLMIAIDDTGCGMAPDALKHIYERFSSGNHNGTGLGLPICKLLAEQMGGSIDISSEVGKGTTVWITMPCKAIEKDRRKQI